ncbi:MAG: peptidase S41, partial [Bacteroidota bacterium]
ALCSQSPLLHFPALSPNGENLAFSYQGDIWTVPSTGGRAQRLTIHESYESHPVWSPNGESIAFVGERYGNQDIFVTTPFGDRPQRITHHSAADIEPSWLNDQELIFTTRRLFVQVERAGEFYRGNLNGGTPTRYLSAVGSDATSSPDGRYIAFVRGGCRISREAYRGPANRDIWLYDTQNDTYTQITKDEGQDYAPTWTLDNQLFFLSAREGRYNLFRIDPLVSATLSQMTDFSDWGIRNYSISADGKSMAIERGTGLELSQDGGTSFQKLNIQVGGDFKFYPTEEKSLSGELREFALSPNEKYLAIGTRGELFIKPNDKDKKRSKNVTEHPYREEDAAWLNDSTLLFTSDRTAAEFPSLLLCQSAPKGNLYQSFARETTTILDLPNGVTDFKLSPDRTKIAIIEGRGGLLVYDIDSLGQLSSKTVLLDGWDYPGGLSWSPDGKWLAYNLSDLDFNEEIYIHASDNNQAPVNVSMHPRGDYSPTWSPDGSKLGFLSIRNNGNADAWFVWLRQEDYERTQRDWEEADDWSNEEEKDTSGTVVIDFANIHERLVG